MGREEQGMDLEGNSEGSHSRGWGTRARASWGPLTLSTEQLPVLVQVGQEEAVDQCGLPQA